MASDPPNRPTTNKRPLLRNTDRPKPALFSDPTKSITENRPPPVSASNPLRGAGIGGIDDGRGAGLERRLPLCRVDVGDNRTGSVKRMAQADRGKAKAASADDHERVLSIDRGGLFERAERREARTPEGRSERRRQRFILDEVSWMFDENVIAEAAVRVRR